MPGWRLRQFATGRARGCWTRRNVWARSDATTRCEDPERRRKAKIPEGVSFQTKPELGVGLAKRAAGWDLPKAPVLGDRAYGDNTELREGLHREGLQYVLAVGAETKVFAPGTAFTVPKRNGPPGRPATRPVADRDAQTITQSVAGLDTEFDATLQTPTGIGPKEQYWV